MWIEGRDAVSFLQGLITQDVAGMEPGSVGRSFLLGPQGKLRALLWVLRGDDRVGLITEAGRGSEVEADLRHYRIRVKADFKVETRPVWDVFPADSWASSPALGTWREDEQCMVATLPTGVLVGAGVCPLDEEPVVSAQLAERARVLMGEPLFGTDVDESTIPQETGLVDEAVSFTKGCYLGQELVARIDTRGHVNRHLRQVQVEGLADIDGPAEVLVAGRAVGRITSWAEESDAMVGLGLIRREVEIGEMVDVVIAGAPHPGRVLALSRRG